jgi:large repetitive protein
VAVVGQPVTFTATVTPASPGQGTPTGLVFFVEDNSVLLGESSLNAAGTATLTTSSLTFGFHTVFAEYVPASTFQGSTSSTIEEFITRAGTEPIFTVVPVRNRHGKVFAVDLVTQVDVISPGSGVPTGSVTYHINGRATSLTVPVTNGIAVLTLSPQRLTNRIVYARYNSDANFIASASSSQLISRKSLLTASKSQKRVEVKPHGR